MASNGHSQGHYFPSKRDWWIVGLIWLGVVVSVVGGIVPLILTGAAWSKMVLVGSVLVLTDSLMLWVLYGTGYTLTQEQLVIRCGPISFHVELEAIESITPTRSPWSSPACSLDRLKIVYGVSQQSLMISPKGRAAFLAAIAKRCPSLIVLHNQVRKKSESLSSVSDPAAVPSTQIVG